MIVEPTENCVLEHRHDRLSGNCQPFRCACGRPAVYWWGEWWLCTVCYLTAVPEDVKCR